MSLKLPMSSLAVGALALAIVAAPAQSQTKLIFSSYLPQTYSTTACDGVFMDRVTERTGGKIVFERYYASALLNAVDTFPGLGRGAADVGISFPGGYNRAQYPLSNIVMPYITSNPEAATLAINALYKESSEFQSEFEKHNVKLLYSLVPDVHTVWSRAPIKTAADLKGKRIRALLAPGDAIAKLGGTPVGMTFPDAIEAMSRGAIDAFANVPFDLGVTAGIYKVAKSVSDVGAMGTYAVSATAINLDKWKTLSPEVQKVMLDTAAEMPKCFIDIIRKDVKTAVETLGKSKSIEVVTFAPEEAKKIRDTVGKELWGEWVQLVTKQGYNGQKLLDRYMELVAQFEKTTTYETGFEQYAKQFGNK